MKSPNKSMVVQVTVAVVAVAFGAVIVWKRSDVRHPATRRI
jgi:hypothetical protein